MEEKDRRVFDFDCIHRRAFQENLLVLVDTANKTQANKSHNFDDNVA